MSPDMRNFGEATSIRIGPRISINACGPVCVNCKYHEPLRVPTAHGFFATSCDAVVSTAIAPRALASANEPSSSYSIKLFSPARPQQLPINPSSTSLCCSKLIMFSLIDHLHGEDPAVRKLSGIYNVDMKENISLCRGYNDETV